MGVIVMRLSALHPHPNPPPSEGEGIFYLPLSAHQGGRDRTSRLNTCKQCIEIRKGSSSRYREEAGGFDDGYEDGHHEVAEA